MVPEGSRCPSLLHCDALLTHANSVLGLVEAGVGVVPSGGGVKETYRRWSEEAAPEKAAWETGMQVGYGKTGPSPEAATALRYYRPGHDRSVMTRDKLISQATAGLGEMAKGYQRPAVSSFTLPGQAILTEMSDFMDKGLSKGWFTPHNKTTAMEIATIVVNTAGDDVVVVSEQDMFDRERAAFLRLAKTEKTRARIEGMLAGDPIDN